MFHINTLNASSRNKCKQYFQFMVLQVLSTLLPLGLLLNDDASFSSSSFIFLVVLGDPGEDQLASVLNHLLDQAFLAQFVKGTTSQRPANLQPFADNSWSDEFVGGNLLVQFVVGGLVKENKIVQFVPGFSLRPLLLFGFPTSSPFFLFRGLGGSFASSLGVLLGTHDGISCRSESSNISL